MKTVRKIIITASKRVEIIMVAAYSSIIHRLFALFTTYSPLIRLIHHLFTLFTAYSPYSPLIRLIHRLFVLFIAYSPLFGSTYCLFTAYSKPPTAYSLLIHWLCSADSAYSLRLIPCLFTAYLVTYCSSTAYSLVIRCSFSPKGLQ